MSEALDLRDALAVAIETLSWISYAGLGERTALYKAAKQLDVSNRNSLRHAHRLVMEVARFRNRLDCFVAQTNPQIPLETLPHGISSFLRILAFLTLIDGADDKELRSAVEAGRHLLGWKEVQPYESAVARIAAGRNSTFKVNDAIQRIALSTCHPEWFVKRALIVFGREFALRVLQRNLRSLPIYVRLNPLSKSAADPSFELQQSLQSSIASPIENVWKISTPSELVKLSKAVSEGEIVVQDFASIVTSVIASPRPGNTVLDVCAAPGNKTTHLASIMENRGEVYAIDSSRTRLSRMRMEIVRTNTKIASPIVADATNLPLNLEADVVLVDPPCSNSGVFARSPSTKWRISESAVKSLAKRQRYILESASNHVRPGGTLVYCTCSILPDENEFVIEHFLRRKPDFELVTQTPFLGLKGMRGFEKCQRFYPHIHNCNGYFISKLLRTV